MLCDRQLVETRGNELRILQPGSEAKGRFKVAHPPRVIARFAIGNPKQVMQVADFGCNLGVAPRGQDGLNVGDEILVASMLCLPPARRRGTSSMICHQIAFDRGRGGRMPKPHSQRA